MPHADDAFGPPVYSCRCPHSDKRHAAGAHHQPTMCRNLKSRNGHLPIFVSPFIRVCSTSCSVKVRARSRCALVRRCHSSQRWFWCSVYCRGGFPLTPSLTSQNLILGFAGAGAGASIFRSAQSANCILRLADLILSSRATFLGCLTALQSQNATHLVDCAAAMAVHANLHEYAGNLPLSVHYYLSGGGDRSLATIEKASQVPNAHCICLGLGFHQDDQASMLVEILCGDLFCAHTMLGDWVFYRTTCGLPTHKRVDLTAFRSCGHHFDRSWMHRSYSAALLQTAPNGGV